MANDVFISYSRRDAERVLGIVDGLRARGISVWIDQRGIGAARRWAELIVRAIEDCRVLIVVVSAASIESDNVVRELSLALESCRSILPAYIEPVTPSPQMRYQIAGLQHLELHKLAPSEWPAVLAHALAELGVVPEPPAREALEEPRPVPEPQHAQQPRPPGLVSLMRSGSPVWCARFLPQPGSIVSCGHDRAVTVWDEPTCEPRARMAGHSSTVWDLDIAAGGRLLVSTGRDKTLRFFDLVSGRQCGPERTLPIAAPCVALSPDGTRLVAGLADGTVRLWELASELLLRRYMGHSDEVWDVAFSSDGSRVLSASRDNTMRMWDATGPFDVRDAQELYCFRGHTHWVQSCAFSPDNQRAISAGADGTVRIWDLRTGQAAVAMRHGEGYVQAAVFLPGGRRALSGGADRDVYLWDSTTGVCEYRLSGHTGWVQSIDVSADGRRALTGSFDGTLRVWRLP